MTDPAERARAGRASLDGPIPALFCLAGAGLGVVGAVPWIAALAAPHHSAVQGATTWAVRVIAALAIVMGVFVLLVGIGLLRARHALRAAAAETQLDTQLLAAAAGADTHDACATDTACTTCDASCALAALRQ